MLIARKILSEQIGLLLGVEETTVKSSDLLKAFATFKTIAEMENDGSGILAKYEKLRLSTKDLPYRREIIEICDNVTESELENAYNSFAALDFVTFFRFIVPDLACDISSLGVFFKDELKSKFVQLSHELIKIRKLLYVDSKNSSEAESAGEDIQDADNTEGVERLYRTYCGFEDSAGNNLSLEQFSKLFKAINLFPLEFDSVRVKPVIDYSSKDLDKLLDIFNNKLDLTRSQQIELCYLFFVESHAKDYIGREKIYNYYKIRLASERRKQLEKALTILAKITPLDALAAIIFRRQRRFQARAGHTADTRFADQTYSPNDVALENSLIYSLMSSSVGPVEKEHTNGVTILFPSPLFVEKWLSDLVLRGHNIRFVFKSEHEKELIKCHYKGGTYASCDKEKVSFLSLSDWEKSLSVKEISLSGERILGFFCGVSKDEQDQIYQLLYHHNLNKIELFLVIGSGENERRSPFLTVVRNSCYRIQTIELIPQGINNSAIPKRKMYICAEMFSVPDSWSGKIELRSDSLNWAFKTQAIVRGTKSVWIDSLESDSNLDVTIRKLYNSELTRSSSQGRKREVAFSYSFTPDLTIWCSKSYPKNNHGRPRLEAYFCKQTPEGKAERGYADRGNMLENTKKHIVTLQENEILDWLKNTYPVSTVRERRSPNKPQLNDIKISIREKAIEYYSDVLANENIAIKTFWYLYPDIQNILTERDYSDFQKMATNTEIGDIRLQDITAESVYDILRDSFDADGERLYWYFSTLSKVVDKAIKLGYCNKNELQQVLQDKKIRDKLFYQVRNALTKKQLTHDEFSRIFQLAAEKFEQGEKIYIGVLIRLLTGLNSNTVCGLKWKDIIDIDDYGIKKIVIARQVTNDGREYKGFESLADYLCFPCSDLLLQYVESARSFAIESCAAEGIAERPIVWEAETKNRGKQAFSPRKLDELCKQLIKSLGLPDRFVVIPSRSEGTKETNLNEYGGDFFRENFRYWSLSLAGMTNDETAYLIGNTPETTFGRYYCDYLNDASQYMLYTKLRRIDAMLLRRTDCDCSIEEKLAIGDEAGRITIETGPEPANVQLKINVPPEASWLKVEVDSKQAFSVFAATLQERNGESK